MTPPQYDQTDKSRVASVQDSYRTENRFKMILLAQHETNPPHLAPIATEKLSCRKR